MWSSGVTRLHFLLAFQQTINQQLFTHYHTHTHTHTKKKKKKTTTTTTTTAKQDNIVTPAGVKIVKQNKS